VHLVTSDKPVAVVMRYGGFGDVLMTTPAVHVLAEQGYFVSYHTYEHAAEILNNNPHVGQLVSYKPDPETGRPPKVLKFDYVDPRTLFLNMSGTCEVSLVDLEPEKGEGPGLIYGCADHPSVYQIGCKQCEEARIARDARVAGRNYYDENMSRIPLKPGQVVPLRPELYFTHEELTQIDKFAEGWEDHFVVIWLQSSTAMHKAYPLWASVAREFCRRYPDALIYSTGDKKAGFLEVHDNPQIKSVIGQWSLREAMALTQFADLVVGCESGIMHAASCYETPKIMLFSHSSPVNLTKYWINCTDLIPDRKAAPCHPCHQVHETRYSCPLVRLIHDYPKVDTGWPICMALGINPDRVLEAMEYWYANNPLKARVN
jgi:ADP-heptose:LPS heptosyltransferase